MDNTIPRAVAVLLLVSAGCSRANPDATALAEARDAVRTTVLSSFATALRAEGPIERKPQFVATEIGHQRARIEDFQPLLATRFPSYDRASFADLVQRLQSPADVTVPDGLSGQLDLVSDSAARLVTDSIALTGQLIVRVAPIGLNPSATRAATMFFVECGPGCGARQLIFLSGKGKRWIPIQRLRLDLDSTTQRRDP